MYLDEKDYTFSNPEILKRIMFTVDDEIKRVGDIPVVVLMDSGDHAEACGYVEFDVEPWKIMTVKITK